MAFFACLYFAALRPEEAVSLRRRDCTLPQSGPGELRLSRVSTRAGSLWTNDGAKHETRGLKHRSPKATRPVPIPAELVRILRDYLEEFGTVADGRLFRSPRGGILDSTRYDAVWKAAREFAFPPDLVDSSLARRPYDLRHAAVSLWLNAGIDVTEIAELAGHSVKVLLDIYAKCIHGRRQRAVDACLSAFSTNREDSGA